MLSRFHRFVIIAATTVALLVATSSTTVEAVGSVPMCNATTCLTPVCGTEAPYRCQVGSNFSCYVNVNDLPACDSVCDVSSCATDSCASTCHPSVCDRQPCPSFVPYVCTMGQSKNACAKSPASFLNNSACGACCDIKSCSAPPSPPSPPSPAPVPQFNCSGDCRAFCDYQFRCAFNEPYMCTSGRSKDGCSANATLWPSEPDFCQSCCDVRKCSMTCTVCPKEQCFAPTCPPTLKYTCTAGADKGGCASTADFWNTNPGCSSCCYCPSSSDEDNNKKKKFVLFH